MLVAKTHPCNSFGWLYISPSETAAAMDEQQRLHDAEQAVDRHFSGEPPAFRQWSIEHVRSLARHERIASQLQQRRFKLQEELQRLERANALQQARFEADQAALLEQLELVSDLLNSSAPT